MKQNDEQVYDFRKYLTLSHEVKCWGTFSRVWERRSPKPRPAGLVHSPNSTGAQTHFPIFAACVLAVAFYSTTCAAATGCK
jgi:hypothetical protein